MIHSHSFEESLGKLTNSDANQKITKFAVLCLRCERRLEQGADGNTPKCYMINPAMHFVIKDAMIVMKAFVS